MRFVYTVCFINEENEEHFSFLKFSLLKSFVVNFILKKLIQQNVNEQSEHCAWFTKEVIRLIQSDSKDSFQKLVDFINLNSPLWFFEIQINKIKLLSLDSSEDNNNLLNEVKTLLLFKEIL